MRRPLALLVLGVAFAIWAWAALAPSGGACILTATYLDAPFVGAGLLPAAEVAGPVGPGTLPACDDTPGGGPVETPTTVTLHRVRGVAPRLGVALPSTSGRASLLALSESPCVARPAARVLECLRRETKRLVRGPSLVAPPSAQMGQVIRLSIRIRDPRLRASAVHGLDSLFQRKVDGRWRSLFQLQHPLPDATRVPDPLPVGSGVRAIGLPAGRAFPVRLPIVDPGQYRIAKEVNIGGRQRWLFAPISIQNPGQGTFLGQASSSASTTRRA